MDLSLRDIERIKETAEKLDTEIDTFFLRKQASYGEILKRSKVLNERLRRVAEMNELQKQEEEEDPEQEARFPIDAPRSDIDEQEIKEFVDNFERRREVPDDSRMIIVQPRIDALIEALKTEVQKRTAACEMEVAQRQARTIERSK